MDIYEYLRIPLNIYGYQSTSMNVNEYLRISTILADSKAGVLWGWFEDLWGKLWGIFNLQSSNPELKHF